MTPAQEFRQFLLNDTRGKEVISPTLLHLKLDILVQQELNFASQAHAAGLHGDNFADWYNGAAKTDNGLKTA
jgi:hypothetical protein